MRSVELGADYALRAGTRLMLTGYQTDLRDLIYQKTVIAGTANDLNRTVNVGAARIRGLESSVRQPLGERWVLSGSVGYTDTEIQRNEISPATVGRRLGDVPLLTATAGLNWSWQRYSLDSHVRYTSHVYTRSDELNANVVNGVFGAYDAYAVVNLKAGAALTRSLRVSLAVDNLLNRTYYAFYRQPGRTWLLDFTTQF
jgi:iron complex outermembrane receptor protein